MRSRDAASTFPRRSAITRRFSLGAPRAFSVAPDGARVAFLRSAAGTDPSQRLWVLDVATGAQRCVADPASLLDDAESLPPEERAHRERSREQAGGIVRFATDTAVTTAVFTLGTGMYLADLLGGAVRELDLPGPAIDPRLDPTGTQVAWVRSGALLTARLDDLTPHVVASDEDPDVTWGLAEFIAAEEMRRSRGYWWAPDGQRILAARVDVGPVARWHIAEPADPASSPQVVRFPAAGTSNAAVTLSLVAPDVAPVAVRWDHDSLPYLTRAFWQRGHPPTIVVQSRDQRRMQVRVVDETTGDTTLVADLAGEPWVEIVPGAPRWVTGGGLLTVVDDIGAGPHGTRRVAVDGKPVTPEGLQVREVGGADERHVLVTASESDPTEVGVWRVPIDGGAPDRLDRGAGVAGVSGRPAAHVLVEAGMHEFGATRRATSAHGSHEIASHAETPGLEPRVEMLELGGDRGLRAALLLPAEHGHGALPVLLDPYGGPHAQRVLRTRSAFLSSQWFAEAGFAVLVVDGRGSPGRGPRWERAIAGDLATAPLDDQIAGLHDAAAQRPGTLDLDRVAIRGWSFGGFLAALAVLRRPDVFHAAVAGAPVTDWRLYDTHYTERYLGQPSSAAEAYDASSLLDEAHRLVRPLLLIHGLADDNVVAAHTLRLSRALLEAGRPHQVLPLSGVTHMTPQERVAENLLTLQLAFLREALSCDNLTSVSPAPYRGL